MTRNKYADQHEKSNKRWTSESGSVFDTIIVPLLVVWSDVSPFNPKSRTIRDMQSVLLNLIAYGNSKYSLQDVIRFKGFKRI